MLRPRHALSLAIAVATSACAEVEYGVPAGGAETGGAPASGGAPANGGSGGGGSAPDGEQCLNGIDDDNDGLADCADDDCGDVSCVDIPPGWLGPVELRADDSPCDGAFSQGIASLKSAVDAPPAMCTCSCAGELQSCEEAELALYGTPACGNQLAAAQLSDAQCELLNGISGTDSYQLAPEGDDASCSSGFDATLPPVTFDARRLCGLSEQAAGCSEGSCAPSSTCVYMSGNVVCPNGFGTPFMGSAGLVDSRDCGPGSCGCAASGGCTFSLELFDGSACQGTPVSSTTTTTCQTVNGFGGASKSALFTSTPGMLTCSPTGTAAPTGSVSLSEPITVCCAL